MQSYYARITGTVSFTASLFFNSLESHQVFRPEQKKKKKSFKSLCPDSPPSPQSSLLSSLLWQTQVQRPNPQQPQAAMAADCSRRECSCGSPSPVWFSSWSSSPPWPCSGGSATVGGAASQRASRLPRCPSTPWLRPSETASAATTTARTAATSSFPCGRPTACCVVITSAWVVTMGHRCT